MSDALRRALRDLPPGDHVDDASLAAYLDGALPDAEREAVERHAGACPLCSGDLAAAVRVEIEAEALEETDRSRRRATVSPLPERRRGSRAWMRLAAAIALAFGALLLGREASQLVVGRLEPLLMAQIEDWSRRGVRTEGTSLVMAGGPGIEIDGFAMSDDPRFADTDFVAARRVSLHVQPSALLGGRLVGSIEVDRPVLRLVRNRAGQWNVETLGGREPGLRAATAIMREEVDRALAEAARDLPPTGAATAPRVQLTSATIEAGVLEISDMSSGQPALRLDDVDLAYHGAPGQRASLSIEGRVGLENDRIALRGEIGPFEGNAMPVYRFREVELEAVPVTGLPGAPSAVEGRLSFGGHLESAGRSLAAIVQAARGAGEIELCCGALRGRNLTHDLLSRLATLQGGDRLLQLARASAPLADALDAPDTRYENLAGVAALEPGTLHVAGLEVSTALFRADADASIALEGWLNAEGSAELAPELAEVLIAAAPALGTLAEADGSIHMPFEVSGRWPDIRVEVDAEQLIARLQRTAPTDLLAFLRFALPRG